MSGPEPGAEAAGSEGPAPRGEGLRFIENRTYDEIAVGDAAELTRRLEARDIQLFAVVSGDVNPAHVDAEYARGDMFHGVIAHGMWGGALISAVLGTELPGPGAIFLSQSLRFTAPVSPGDVVTARVEVTEKRPRGRMALACACRNQRGETVIEGEAVVIAPAEKVRRPRVSLPEVHLHARGARHARLVEAARALPPMRAAVVHPCDAPALAAALEAAEAGLIDPVLVGPRAKIEAAAEAAGRGLEGVEIRDAPHSHAAAEAAVALARDGAAQALVKGSLSAAELLAALRAAPALATERRLSHVHVLDAPSYPRPLLVTDGMVNIHPDLAAKRDILRNAVDLARALGTERPRAAILSATDRIDPALVSSLDAAALCKMAERGQISGGAVDGPLTFDQAVSPEAAAGLAGDQARDQARDRARERAEDAGEVAGRADILLAPDLEAADMIAKQLVFLAGAEAAGLALGARVPVALGEPGDAPRARLAACALARLRLAWGDGRAGGGPGGGPQ